MKKSYDVIIVGAGIIGCSIAYQLSKQGQNVLVLEKDKIASQASSAAAGMLGLEMEHTFRQNSSLFSLAKKSRAMFPNLQKELKELSGIDIDYCQNGFLKVAQTDEEVSLLYQEMAHHQKKGILSEFLSPENVHQLEPALSQTIRGALYVPEGANVSAEKLTYAFAYSASKLGVHFQENTEVSELITHDDHVIGVQTLTGDVYADDIIVAAGAWSARLLKQNDIHLKTYPVKGECFSVQTTSPLLTSTIYTKNCYIVPKPGGELVIGATEISRTFSEKVSLGSVFKLMDLASTLIPALKDTAFKNVWSGVRPQTLTGRPYVERHSSFKNLTIATGHYRNGILLAPVTGVHVAALLAGKASDMSYTGGESFV